MSSSTTRSSAARSGRSRSQNKHDRKSSDSVAASDKLKQLHSGKQKEDRVLEEKIGQVVQLTGCSKDEAFVALYDCDNDPVRAIDMLLESDDQGKWVESTKKKRPPKLPASSDAKPPSPDDPAARVEESARGSGGAERGRSRSRGGVQPPRLRHSAGGGDEGGSWKARERRENEKNAWVGRGGGSGARGGRGGRRGGLAPRVFQSRQRMVPASQSTADDWGGSLDAWNSTSDAWNTSDTVPAVPTVTDAWNGTGGASTTSPVAAPSAVGGGTVAPTEELDEWSGPLTETKVFTPSGGPTTNSESAADGPSTAASAAVLGPSLDLASLLGKPSSAAAGPVAAAAASSASGVYSQFGSAATETRSLAAAAGGGGGSSTAGGSTGYSYSDVAAANSAYMGVVTASRPAADTQQPPTPPSAPPISRYSDSAAGLGHSSDYSGSGFADQIASSIASSSPSSLPPASSASQALPHKPKPNKTRFFPSAKIPESAVEMPSDSIGTLSVQFGGLDFGTSDIGSSFHRPAAVPADQSQYSAQSVPTRADVGEVVAAHSPSKVQQNNLDPAGSSRVSSLASVDVGGGASSGGGNYVTSAAAGGPSSLYSPQKPASAAANSNGPLLSSSATGASYSVSSAASQPSVASSAPAAAAGANSYSVASSYHQLSAAGSVLTTADATSASGVNSYSTGSSQQPPAPGFGGYVNGAPSSVSSGAGAAASSYLGASSGVSIKDKLANALAAPSVSKPGQLDGMSVTGSSMPTSGGANPSSASGISSSMPSSANNGSMAAHKLTATAGRSSGGNMPSLPPGVPMQYFMGQAGMPAFYPGVQQIYGYEDLHALQQRLPHLQQQTSADQSRGDASSLTSGSAAAGVYSDINKYGRQDNSSPVQSSLSQQQQSQSQQQQQQQQQTQQQQYFNPAAIPPNYTYYPYLPPYGIYTPLPQAANAAPPHQATTQYQQKLSGYNSAAGYGGYDSLVSTAAAAAAAAGQPDYKSAFGGGPAGGGGTGGGGSGLPGQAAHAHKQPSATSDIYGKMQLSGTKFDNKGFHAATPPPFGLAGAAGQGAPLAAGSAYAPHHMYIQPMTAAQHPSQVLGHPSHHHHQDSTAGGVGPGGGQRGAGPAQGSKSVKPGYSTGYWSGN